ncbi:MAG: DegT/DnrJ/EryC1/StrS family aminotransferase [Anaerolineae bacterium]|nr:DegT/DnrJ/EryC1/StrS family aminotransferase [Anaerolineae bacterium]
MKIPFNTFERQVARLQPEIDAAIGRVLQRGWFILGPELEKFEAEFAAYIGVPYAVGCNSGTDAIELCFRALGIGPGDEVITSPLTAAFGVFAITAAGATPVFVDIDPLTYNLDPNQIEAAITSRTRAIMPVHLYGQPADMGAILEIAEQYELFVVEDCAQAHGGRYRGQRVGSLSDVAAFSFYPTKNLGAYGDGGMVVTSSPAVAERVRMLRNGGQRSRYVHETVGLNSRLDELQAAILSVKLGHLDTDNARRREIAARYDALLAGGPVETPWVAPDVEPVYHLYVVRTPERDALMAHLAGQGVGTLVHYPTPTHLQGAYQSLGLGPGALPQAEAAAREILSLPLYPELTDDEVAWTAQAVHQFAGVLAR